MSKFHEVLKELRIEKGLTRQQLASLIFVNVRTISYWELGQRECNLDQLIKLAKLFGVTTDYLLKDEIENEEFTDGTVQGVKRVTM